MIFAAVTALLCVLAIGLVMDRSMLSPLTVFGGVWLLTLLAVWISQPAFFAPTDFSLAIYTIGALSFVCGSLLIPRRRMTPVVAVQSGQLANSTLAPTQYLLSALVLVLVVSLPIFIRAVIEIAGGAPIGVLLNVMRRADVQSEAGALTGGVLGNLVVLSQFVAIACYFEANNSRPKQVRAAVAVIMAFFLGALSGSKGNAVSLILTLFFVGAIKRGYVSVGSVLRTFVLIVALFGAGVWAVNFAGIGGSGEWRDLVASLGAVIMNYWVGGLIAFGEIAQGGVAAESHQTSARFFLESLQSLGVLVSVPSIHAPYVTIGDGQDTNTYTIYFSYFQDGGIAAVVLAMAILGALTTLSFQVALRGTPMAMLLYAMFCVSLVLSIHAEHFAVAANKFIKALLFFWILYRLPHYIFWRRDGAAG